MIQLNKEQTLAVRHADGPMLVLAGPGSGKTFVLTERIRFLIQEKNIRSNEILVITFSKKAAEEMRQRFQKLCTNTYDQVRFGTFHAIFFHILQHYHNYQKESILTHTAKKEYIRNAAKHLDPDELYDDTWCEDMLYKISRYKNAGENAAESVAFADEKQTEQFLTVYSLYQKQCHMENTLDFDDMIIKCYRLFAKNPNVCGEWRKIFQYILIDEFQDCSLMQYEIIKLLAGEACNLFAVGDDDQSIYGFRGAKPSVVSQFIKDFPACKQVFLSKNYRCDRQIIEISASLIAHNHSRVVKEACAVSSRSENKDTVFLFHFQSMEEEAEFVAKKLKQLYFGTQRIAVLYRIGSCANLLEEKITIAGLPYERKEKQKGFYEEDWVRDIFSYLKIASGSSGRNDLFRILNKPDRNLSRECVSSKKELAGLLHACRNIAGLPPFAAVNYILKGIGYDRYMRKRFMKSGSGNEEINAAVEELLLRSRKFHTIREWLVYVEDLESMAAKCAGCQTGRGISPAFAKEKIILQTIHAAKGLEYDTVFVIGMQEGILPHKKAVTNEALEEERRLLYVAMTRAKQKLYLCVRGGEQQGKGMSRFAGELGISVKTVYEQ